MNEDESVYDALDRMLGKSEHVRYVGEHERDDWQLDVRGEYVLARQSAENGYAGGYQGNDVSEDATSLAATLAEFSTAHRFARLEVDHQWEREHPHDVSAPCSLALVLVGWRLMTDAERARVALARAQSPQEARRRRDAQNDARALAAIQRRSPQLFR